MNVTGERIKLKRKEKRLTQEQLAKLVNKSKQVISNWERGYSNPIDEDIASLSLVLGVSSDYLLGTEARATDKEIPQEDRKSAAMARVAEQYGFDLEKKEDWDVIEELFRTASKIRRL